MIQCVTGHASFIGGLAPVGWRASQLLWSFANDKTIRLWHVTSKDMGEDLDRFIKTIKNQKPAADNDDTVMELQHQLAASKAAEEHAVQQTKDARDAEEKLKKQVSSLTAELGIEQEELKKEKQKGITLESLTENGPSAIVLNEQLGISAPMALHFVGSTNGHRNTAKIMTTI